ncbi:type II toxin-antitoxin system HicA family toxin [Candidatus Woesearchaeota archaeon]|nr:type II toxin-antitoxin system HicA family toxin [Candidatus Woesearchaeota archaeon]
MPKLPVVSGSQVIKALSKIGYQHVRTSGSHAILKKQSEDGTIVIPVPLHDELAKGTLQSIQRQTKLLRDDFILLLTK